MIRYQNYGTGSYLKQWCRPAKMNGDEPRSRMNKHRGNVDGLRNSNLSNGGELIHGLKWICIGLSKLKWCPGVAKISLTVWIHVGVNTLLNVLEQLLHKIKANRQREMVRNSTCPQSEMCGWYKGGIVLSLQQHVDAIQSKNRYSQNFHRQR